MTFLVDVYKSPSLCYGIAITINNNSFVLYFLTEASVVFFVNVYKSASSEDMMVPINCVQGGDISFINSNWDEHKTPLLIVYSYQRQEANLRGLVLNAALQQQRRNSDDTPDQQYQQRRKRQSAISCTSLDLMINVDRIPGDAVNAGTRTFTVLYPSRYNARICSGICNNNIPSSDSNLYQHISASAIRVGDFSGRSFRQCCSPSSYGPLNVLVRYRDMNEDTLVFVTIQDMLITGCGCQYAEV